MNATSISRRLAGPPLACRPRTLACPGARSSALPRRTPVLVASASKSGLGDTAPAQAAPTADDAGASVSSPSMWTSDESGDDDQYLESPAVKDCVVFIDRDDQMVPILCCDYGFRSGTGRMYQDADGKLPDSALAIGWANFKTELEALRRSLRYDEFSVISKANPATGVLGKAVYAVGGGLRSLLSKLDRSLEGGGVLKTLEPPDDTDDVADVVSDCSMVQENLKKLTLSNDAVWAREHKREDQGSGVETPWVVRVVYIALCVFLDIFYDKRPIQRFWFLETVARMPYFSYISVLHLYESLGWWRAGAELRKVHFAEEWNELTHMQIMESLGGDQLWVDRFMGQHAAIVYYWILVVMYMGAPKLAYNFSELIEAHAVDTYGEFADANKDLLKTLPPPIVAAQYYSSKDLYLFQEFQTSEEGARRRPKCASLYDVFCNIRDDEGEHVKTMRACQDMSVINDLSERRRRGRMV
ncbi:hypothetical protein FOA52_015495 [Chlamydomonas sp. UWO 241]|nr:hypothetical protein FOA52_015495 [Chlamydomonas sp. UWO 241]